MFFKVLKLTWRIVLADCGGLAMFNSFHFYFYPRLAADRCRWAQIGADFGYGMFGCGVGTLDGWAHEFISTMYSWTNGVLKWTGCLQGPRI